MAVTVVHFNPKRRAPGPFALLRPRRELGNFGDLLGPLLVERVAAEFGLSQAPERRRLVSIGSILGLTEPGDTVWGSGVNGKSMNLGAAPDLDVRSVRGPETRRMLTAAGTSVPEVYGDPALLWSRYWNRDFYLRDRSEPLNDYVVLPNYNDLSLYSDSRVVSPIGDPHHVIAEIARSSFVCGSSLHGIVLAESLGIPARLITSQAEHSLKYDDYYFGSGRSSYAPASSVEEALAMGGEAPPEYDVEALLQAFPRDLYQEP
ncbi:polysaccharide pyruvyl transferase family protein [Serinibacter arcticus]|uniref:polysaccharide pyruvyl transferase family protein n=1 Tax=Serinibacter arcticus TaxID=1655435 RepID=UPI0013050F3D|nr:polysaccharide pyruvyl transferase family protein [Serinibacter arcticus]